jgi:hypothetical protein
MGRKSQLYNKIRIHKVCEVCAFASNISPGLLRFRMQGFDGVEECAELGGVGGEFVGHAVPDVAACYLAFVLDY